MSMYGLKCSVRHCLDNNAGVCNRPPKTNEHTTFVGDEKDITYTGMTTTQKMQPLKRYTPKQTEEYDD